MNFFYAKIVFLSAVVVLIVMEGNADDLKPADTTYDSVFAMLVGQRGHIERIDLKGNVLCSRQIGSDPGIRVGCADLTPDGKRLLCGVWCENPPLWVIDSETLDHDASFKIPFPVLSSRYSEHQPTKLFAVTSRYVYFFDDYYLGDVDTSGCVLLDMSDRKAIPIEKDAYSWPRSKDSFLLSPSEDRMLQDSAYSVRIVDVATGKILQEVSKVSTTIAWAETQTIDFDWSGMQGTWLWRTWGDNKKWNYATAKIEIDTAKVRAQLLDEPPRFGIYQLPKELKAVLIAYGRGVGVEGGNLPLFDRRVQGALKRIGPHTLEVLPFTPEGVYLTPGGNKLVATRVVGYEKDERGQTMAARSSVAILDLDTGTLDSQCDFPDYITTVLFRQITQGN